MNNKSGKNKLFAIIAFSMLFFAVAASAQILPPPSGGSCPAGSRASSDCGNYSVNDFLVLGINVARFIWGISGSLALAYFIYGGFIFLISAGQSGKIQEAKTIITNAIIGLIVIFGSYVFVGFILVDVLKVKGLEGEGGRIKWATTGWYNSNQ